MFASSFVTNEEVRLVNGCDGFVSMLLLINGLFMCGLVGVHLWAHTAKNENTTGGIWKCGIKQIYPRRFVILWHLQGTCTHFHKRVVMFFIVRRVRP